MRGPEIEDWQQLEQICGELADQTADKVERAALLEMAENYRAALLHTHDTQ